MKKTTLLFLAAFLLGSPAIAASGGATSGTKFFFSAGLKAGYGSMKSIDGSSIANRNFGVYSIDSDLGLSLGRFKFGGALDYSLWLQMKDPAKLGGSNTQGKALTFGPMLGYNFGSFELQGRYFLNSTYTLDRPTAAGLSVKYLDPESAFSIQARVPFGAGSPYLGFEYKSVTYKKAEVGTQETIYASGAKVKTSAFGLILGLSY